MMFVLFYGKQLIRHLEFDQTSNCCKERALSEGIKSFPNHQVMTYHKKQIFLEQIFLHEAVFSARQFEAYLNRWTGCDIQPFTNAYQ